MKIKDLKLIIDKLNLLEKEINDIDLKLKKFNILNSDKNKKTLEKLRNKKVKKIVDLLNIDLISEKVNTEILI